MTGKRLGGVMQGKRSWLTVVPAVLAVVSIFGGTALAIPVNITVPDTSYSGSGWYGDREDQEVEPGCVTAQIWDLEALVLDGSNLTLYSGYNMNAPPSGGLPGDIFLDTNGDAVFGQDIFTASGGNGNFASVSNAGYRYDYVIDIRDDGSSYDVYRLGAASLVSVYYRQNDESNPWRYESGGTLVGSGTYSLLNLGAADFTVAGAQLTGGTHYATSFDVGFLNGSAFLAKFTMQCGNDNILGRAQAVPEPGMLLLLGAGLLGLGVLLCARKPA